MRIVVAILLLSCFSATGQNWQIAPCRGICSEASEIACCLMKGQVVVSRESNKKLINDRELAASHFELLLAEKVRTFDTLIVIGALLNQIRPLDDGTAYFSKHDSTLWISSANAQGYRNQGQLGIYFIQWKGNHWGNVQAFKYNSNSSNLAHPWLDPKGERIFFSSDRPGGVGGMDVWFCNKNNDVWSNPIPMPGINSTFNELFPTYFNGCLYFSSDRNSSGLNIYRSERKWQWERCEKLEAPFNSDSDDFQLVYVDHNKAFLTSNRGSDNDNVFVLSKKVAESKSDISGLIECLGLPVREISVRIWNSRGEELVNTKTDSHGSFKLIGIQPNQSYILKVEGMPPEALDKSYVYFVNEEGDRIRVFKLDGNGSFEFQYLPGDLLSDLEQIENEDQSILMIPLEGQVFEDEPGDVGKDEAVYIMDTGGNLLSMVYTSSKGKFSVPELRPISQYTFQLDQQGRELKLLIMDGDKTKEITVIDGRAQYERLSKFEAIRILDENQKPLFIKNDEVFIIKDIYYQFDSVRLNVVAQQQLTQLAAIMRTNPKITIELSSHTDSRGTNEYNLELSNRRAETAHEFLVSCQVEPRRILAIGLGESQLTNHCLDDVGCSEELHAKNRRTEIKIKVEK